MKKIKQINYDFISIDFENELVEKMQSVRTIEIVNIFTVDCDTKIELDDCVTEVAKGDTIMIVKYFDKKYNTHYKIVPLEGVTCYDMLEIAKIATESGEGKQECAIKDESEE